MKLYEVNAPDGARYWVAADTCGQAIALCAEAEAIENAEEYTDSIEEGPDAYELDENTASKRHFISDEDGSRQTMWSVFSGMTSPEVIACSEWP